MSNLIVQPTYLKEFKCIATECKESCCKEWTISVDKQTYRKYKNIKNKDIRAKILNNITPQKNMPLVYATMNLCENKICSLEENGLCYIQKELGSNYLSNTCRQFPRLFNIIDNEAELSLSVACEEAARLIMDNKDGIDFELAELQDTSKITPYYTNSKQDKLALYNIRMHDIRPFIIEILQFRDFSINHRLMITGLLLRKIETATSLKEIDNILETFRSHICEGVYDSLMEDVAPNEEIFLKQQFDISYKFINSYLRISMSSSRLINICDNLESNFLDPSENKLNTEKLITNHKTVKSFIKENEYLIENYLVNYVFSKRVPCSENLKPSQTFALMALRIFILKLLLSSELKDNSITKEEAIRLMSTISRSIDHNDTLTNAFIGQLERQEVELCVAIASV